MERAACGSSHGSGRRLQRRFHTRLLHDAVFLGLGKIFLNLPQPILGGRVFRVCHYQARGMHVGLQAFLGPLQLRSQTVLARLPFVLKDLFLVLERHCPSREAAAEWAQTYKLFLNELQTILASFAS